jgi:hypothetical protein
MLRPYKCEHTGKGSPRTLEDEGCGTHEQKQMQRHKAKASRFLERAEEDLAEEAGGALRHE